MSKFLFGIITVILLLSCNEDPQYNVTVNTGSVYQVSIRTALQIVYTVITEDLTVTIPKNTLESGSYLVGIRAQNISGDI
jgi:hypothetical protein